MKLLGPALAVMLLAACGAPGQGAGPAGPPPAEPSGEAVPLGAGRAQARFSIGPAAGIDLVVAAVDNPDRAPVSLAVRWRPGPQDAAVDLPPVGLFPVDRGGRYRIALPDAASRRSGRIEVELQTPSPAVRLQVNVQPN
ncbi:hypothetical protein E5163_07740 [Marinicauda algicola]|uniref:Lipoprotein n=1 Tax=Marinicauda algicola TaxID=2029849 RepID=A0A4S2H0R5_9PROT|nr:hypothetical protein [Marinicauda algicola]TGY89014.1 hypothetical protein E5163_07740 [Marinicauda algicola]